MRNDRYRMIRDVSPLSIVWNLITPSTFVHTISSVSQFDGGPQRHHKKKGHDEGTKGNWCWIWPSFLMGYTKEKGTHRSVAKVLSLQNDVNVFPFWSCNKQVSEGQLYTLEKEGMRDDIQLKEWEYESPPKWIWGYMCRTELPIISRQGFWKGFLRSLFVEFRLYIICITYYGYPRYKMISSPTTLYSYTIYLLL